MSLEEEELKEFIPLFEEEESKEAFKRRKAKILTPNRNFKGQKSGRDQDQKTR